MHYAILVIGDDIEEQMAPYDENREVPRYKERVSEDDVQRSVEFFKNRRWLEWSTAPSAENVVRYEDQRRAAEATGFDAWTCLVLYNDDEHENLGRDDEGFFRWSTYNPDGKWDYWRIGGRYTRRLTLRPGAEGHREPLSWEWTFNARHGGKQDDPRPPQEGVDQARKGAVDFDGVQAKYVTEAENAWTTFEEIVTRHGPLPSWVTEETKEARDAYWKNPTVEAMRGEDGIAGWDSWWLPRDFETDRETFVETHRLRGVCPFYGYVHEGRWVEKESWNRETKAFDVTPDFYRQAAELLLSLPDETLLTVVDIHS